MSEENEIIETDEPKDEVEGHGGRISQSDEPATDDDVEAHMKISARTDARIDARVD